MTINNIDFIKSSHDGLVISDVTSAAFIEDLPWEKIDISVFSWQKALGSESQHGIIVMSPKAMERLKKRNYLNNLINKEKLIRYEIEELEKSNILLSDNIDTDYIEISLRDKFLLGKKGETVYIIKNE